MAKTKWVDELKENGYKYILKLAADDNEIYATKANMKKDGSFPDKSNWDVFEFLEGETWDKRRKLKTFHYIGE